MIQEQDIAVFQGRSNERSALGPSISHPVKMMNGFVNKGNRNDVEFADKKLDDLISAAKSRDKTSPVSKEAVFEHYIKSVSEKLDEKCDEYARCAARHKKICNEISELK